MHVFATMVGLYDTDVWHQEQYLTYLVSWGLWSPVTMTEIGKWTVVEGSTLASGSCANCDLTKPFMGGSVIIQQQSRIEGS